MSDTPAPAPAAPAPAPAAAPAQPATITFDDFAKVDLRVATILEAREHPKADKLLVLKVDAGEAEPRQLCAGIRGYYDVAALVGRQIVIVANLAPRVLRGEVSNGMLLAASPADKSQIVLLAPSAAIAPGSKVS